MKKYLNEQGLTLYTDRVKAKLNEKQAKDNYATTEELNTKVDNVSTPNKVYGRKDGAWSEVVLPKEETVRVALTTSNGQPCVGQIVTINGIGYKYEGSAIEVKIPFGVEYTISADSKSGFISPSEQSFVASQTLREVTMTYGELPVGVRILGINGNLYKDTEWTLPNEQAVGVYVGDNAGHRFIVAKTNTNPAKSQWGGYGSVISGLPQISSESDAKLDWDGKGNTDKIIAQLKDSELSGNYAARLCKLYQFPGKWSGKGYLGAGGEWWLVFQNYIEINKCLQRCGGVQFSKSAELTWTSTQMSSVRAWYLSWGYDSLSNHDKNLNSFYVRPFASL